MPNDFPSYKKWLQSTSRLGHPRNAQLKDLDEAINRYELAGGDAARSNLKKTFKENIRVALDAWKKAQGPGDTWKRSERNKKERAFERLTAWLSGEGDTDQGVGESPAFMHENLAHARLGVIFLFANTKVSPEIFNVLLEGGLAITGGALGYPKGVANDVGTNLSTVMVPGSAILNAAASGARQADSGPQLQTLKQRVKQWLESFITKVWENIKESFSGVDLTISAIKNLLSVCMGIFLEAVAPFVSAGMDITKGVVNTLDACIARFKTWHEGQGVKLLSGHPSIIVDGITRGMNMSIGAGLCQTLKGAGSMAIAGAGAAVGDVGLASMIFNILTAIAELIVKLVRRLFEVAMMKKFFKQAETYWQMRQDPSAIHLHPIEFSNWFKSTPLLIPAVSILTLNSGICGDKMHFLKMYSDETSVISQSEFDHGCVFVDHLKSRGSDYLKDCGYNFTSNDPIVSGVLELSTKHQGAKENLVWNVIRKVANA